MPETAVKVTERLAEIAAAVEELGHPLYPGAFVRIAQYVAVDAWSHLMLDTVAALRREGASEEVVEDYRVLAVSSPWYTTGLFVTTKKGTTTDG